MHRFTEISKELLGKCNSDAYIFVNQPGISKLDFLDHKREFNSLQRYIHSSSTALKFEKVEVPQNETFDTLIEYVKDRCKIDKVIKLRGNSSENFDPYIDVERRVIRIDYPILPKAKEMRRKAINDYDKFLRMILAQIPSPAQTVIFTSLEPGKVSRHEAVTPIQIFPELFLEPSRKLELEKNDHNMNIPPTFNEHRTKYSQMSSDYVSIFDSKFISDNYDLIRLIITALIGFLILQVLLPKRKHIGTNSSSKLVAKKTPKKEPKNKSARHNKVETLKLQAAHKDGSKS